MNRRTNIEIVLIMVIFSMRSLTNWSSGLKADDQDELASRTFIQAILYEKAMLPCNLAAYDINNTVNLITWYKNQQTRPIYSFDMRKNTNDQQWLSVPVTSAARKSSNDYLAVVVPPFADRDAKNRSYFRLSRAGASGTTASLVLENVTDDDQGEYQCRIEFIQARTKVQHIQLTVIVPPDKPKIYDERGIELNSIAGPYEEGIDIKFTCAVYGGRPEPVLKWWRGETLLESSEISDHVAKFKSKQILIENLQRTDQQTSLTCQALNNNISQPVSTTIYIEMHYRPISVDIITEMQPFSENRNYKFQCDVIGSRPPPKISWWLDQRELFNHTQTDSITGNSSISILQFIPQKTDNSKVLSCRATNSFVKNGLDETSIKLNVLYSPINYLTFGKNMNPDDIEENDDVYFECQINANPSVYKVVWRHNNEVIQTNLKNGIIISNEALVLQKVTHEQSGNYTCTASNVEGDGQSNSVQLKIMYKPICKRPQSKPVYGIGYGEPVKIRCEITAYPPAEQFDWFLNNSETHQVHEIVSKNPLKNQSQPFIIYEAATVTDYGTILCRARNAIGQQREPCRYRVLAAVKPHVPENCTFHNQTSDSLTIICSAVFDSPDHNQHFVLELYDHTAGTLVRVARANQQPAFTLENLPTGQLLRIVIYAVNVRGRSDSVILETFTLKAAEKRTSNSTTMTSRNEFPLLLFVLISIIVILMFIVGLITKSLCHNNARRKLQLRTFEQQLKRTSRCPTTDQVTVTLRPESQELLDKDEQNPDVIPSSKDSDQQTNQKNNYHFVTANGNGIMTAAAMAIVTPSMATTVASPACDEFDAIAKINTVSPLSTRSTSSTLPQQSPVPITTSSLNYYNILTNNVLGGTGNGALHEFKNEQPVYAELNIGTTNTIKSLKKSLNQSLNAAAAATTTSLLPPTPATDSVIYAQIDHSSWKQQPQPQPPYQHFNNDHHLIPSYFSATAAPPQLTPPGYCQPRPFPLPHPREIVTVKTPLRDIEQESCV